MEAQIQDEELGPTEMGQVRERRRTAVVETRKTNRALAANLLQILGPHNWIRCSNCGAKNQAGTHCDQCGHEIQFT